MKSLIDGNFERHYRLNNKLSIAERTTTEPSFDLDDTQRPDFIRATGTGIASFRNDKGAAIAVLDYESFIKGYENRPSFTDGRKRCDFIMECKEEEAVVFCELTTSSRGVENLTKPIVDKRKKRVLYSGGKFEKIECQLAESVETLVEVPKIGRYLSVQKRRVCLCSYRLHYPTDGHEEIRRAREAFNRYLKVEGTATGGHGAMLHSPAIEALDFQYVRIMHPNSFSVC